MADRIFIDGAAGTTGLEILDRLNGRSEFELIQLDAAHRKSAEARREALNEADIAILCLPDDAARDAVELLDPAKGTRIIDASSAHRTTEGWCYGFPELVGRERVADARRVSNPGCYPTGFLGLVAPLVREGLLPADWPFTVNAVSGYSGGGKAMIADFERDDAPGFRAYGYDLRHKHLPEMQARAGLEHSVLFAPAVVPVYRGMIVEVPQLVLQREAEPWGGMELFVFGNEGGSNARLVARLDNLGKGASGAAIQNLNLMCGLPETTGLSP